MINILGKFEISNFPKCINHFSFLIRVSLVKSYLAFDYTYLALCFLRGSMTPEELNRTIEFIVQSQARLAAAQEQDRVDRLEAEKELKAFDRRLANLLEIQVRLLESQTARLDEYREAQRRQEAFLVGFRDEFLDLMRGVRSSLDRILDKLTDRLN